MAGAHSFTQRLARFWRFWGKEMLNTRVGELVGLIYFDQPWELKPLSSNLSCHNRTAQGQAFENLDSYTTAL